MEDGIIIKLQSNIILKSIYIFKDRGADYVPIELLSQTNEGYFKSTSTSIFWSQDHKIRSERLLWYSKKVVDIYEENPYFEIDHLDTLDNVESSIKEPKTLPEENREIENTQEFFKSQDINPVITTILNKFPFEKNLTCRYISSICSEIGNSISFSEENKYDELVFSLDKVRESYRKLMHIIFELKLGFNVKALGEYYANKNIYPLEHFCKENNMDKSYITNLIKFHELINAFGHKNENGDRRAQNNRTIEEFKSSSSRVKNNILLAVPSFLSKISLSNAEMKSIRLKLSIE